MSWTMKSTRKIIERLYIQGFVLLFLREIVLECLFLEPCQYLSMVFWVEGLLFIQFRRGNETFQGYVNNFS